MTQLQETLTRSAPDLAGFAVMFFIVFFAFAQFGNIVFGANLGDYKTFLDTMYIPSFVY